MRLGSGWEFYMCESHLAAVFSLPLQTILVFWGKYADFWELRQLDAPPTLRAAWLK